MKIVTSLNERRRIARTTSLGNSVFLDKNGDLVKQAQNLEYLKPYEVLSVREIDSLNQYGKPLKWEVTYK